jgi:hypothetical protein
MKERQTMARFMMHSLLLAIALGFGVSPANAATWLVSQTIPPCVTATSRSDDPTTIQAAINGAAPGDTVVVCPGIYQEQININKPLTLKGATNESGSLGAVVIKSPASGLVPVSASGALVQVLVNGGGRSSLPILPWTAPALQVPHQALHLAVARRRCTELRSTIRQRRRQL